MKKSTKLLFLPFISLMLAGCDWGKEPSAPEIIAAISLNKTNLVLKVTEGEKLVPNATNGEGAITWTTSNPAVVSVGADGTVTAVGKGTATVTATYSGVSASCTVVVKGIDDLYQLTSVQMNENIKDFQLNVLDEHDEFRGETSSILEIGDDNPFQMKPVLKILDLETMEEAPEEVWDFDYEYEIKELVESEYTAVTGDYVEFDARKVTFDFNEAAIGKQFKLTVIPGGLSETLKAKPEYRKEIEVKVSNGYNVYSADELAYANDVNFLLEDRQRQENGVGLNEGWVNFRSARNMDTSYVAPAIFLQKNIQITKENLPAAYFYTAEEVNNNQEKVGLMKDAVDVYCHYVDGYTFNGNYFHIDTQNMPLSTENGEGYDDGVSHTTLFKVCENGINDSEERLYKNVYFKNCSYYGNSPRGNEAKDSMGLIFFKITNSHYANNCLITATFDNFNVTRACISFFGEVGQNKLIIKDCVVSEGYSNAIYLWANGGVDFINSKMANFGGPVIITDAVDERTQPGFKITADDATIFDNYIVGTEPWFVNTKGGMPSTALATQIKPLDYFVQQGSNNSKTFIGPEQKMNLVIINYNDYPYMSFQKGATAELGGDNTNPLMLGAIGPTLNLGAPVFQTSNGGLGYFNGSSYIDLTQTVYGVENPIPLGGQWLDFSAKLDLGGQSMYVGIVFELFDIN